MVPVYEAVRRFTGFRIALISQFAVAMNGMRGAGGYCYWLPPRSPCFALVIVRGLYPVQRLKARENAAWSE